MHGDQGLFREVSEAFLVEGRELLAQMSQALATDDANLLRRAAHTLKGGLRTVGCEEVAAEVVRMEEAARHGDIAEAATMFPSVQEATVRFLDELTRYLESLQSTDGATVTRPL